MLAQPPAFNLVPARVQDLFVARLLLGAGVEALVDGGVEGAAEGFADALLDAWRIGLAMEEGRNE